MNYYLNIDATGEIVSFVEMKGKLKESETCIKLDKKAYESIKKKVPIQNYKYVDGKIKKRSSSEIKERQEKGDQLNKLVQIEIKKRNQVRSLSEKMELGIELTSQEQNFYDENKNLLTKDFMQHIQNLKSSNN